LVVKTSLKIAPNPADDFINIEFFNFEKGKSAQLVILDLQGRLLIEKEIDNFGKNDVRIDVSKFASGHYVAKLKIRHRVESASFLKM